MIAAERSLGLGELSDEYRAGVSQTGDARRVVTGLSTAQDRHPYFGR